MLGSCAYGYDFSDDRDADPLQWASDHGTNIAGIIAAVSDDANGVAGIAQNVEIMALKTDLYISEIIEAIDFARLNGAKIINMSYG